ncbi:MAG TPA: DUF5336 domain-containing protein [Mycobacteriales bacterium]
MTAPTTSTPPAARLIGMSRGDGLTAIAGLLVFIFSFLPQVGATSGGISYAANMWHALSLVEIFAVPLLALVVVAFTLVPIQQAAYADADILGIRPAAWRTVLSLVVAVASIFAIFFWSHVASDSNGHIGYGAYLVLVFGILGAVGAIAPAYVPDLRLPLMTPRTPKAPPVELPDASGAAGWQPPVQPEQDYPPAPAPVADAAHPAGGPDPTRTFEPIRHDEPVAFEPEPSGEPVAPEPVAPEPLAPEPLAPEPAVPDPAAPPPARPAPFEPYWACFPTVRPLVDRTNTALTIGQVSPEEWYLVTGMDERGASVSTSDGRSGLLVDTSGLIRADQTG